jgi:peptidoglycan/LPS O-acetylase OafA/YrhL
MEPGRESHHERGFSGLFIPGQNRFELLRHVFASMVLLDHAFVLAGFGHVLARTPVRYSLGHLAVAAFFIVSGALVTASRENCVSTQQFLRNRALRIFPAYAVCLCVSAFLIAPLNAALVSRSLSAFASNYADSPGPIGYVLKNLALMQFQLRIGHVFAGHTEDGAVNGSLWSIPWEAGCYLVVAALGIIGSKPWRKIAVSLALVVAFGNLWLAPSGSFFGLYYVFERDVLVSMYFLLGMAFYLFRGRVRRRGGVALLALVGFAGASLINVALAAPFFAYLIFFVAARRQATPRKRTATDISYGLYIYGFPIQQTLVTLGVYKLGAAAMVLGSALLVPPLALLSWRWVEAPALALKRRSLRATGDSRTPNAALVP